MPMINKLATVLKNRRVSVYQAAKDMGVHKDSLYRLTRDEKELPSMTILKTLCQHFDAQPGEFIEYIHEGEC